MLIFLRRKQKQKTFIVYSLIPNLIAIMRRNIVILANSNMYGGRCIAGKDLKTKEWIRLRSPFEHVGLNGAFSYQDLLELCGNINGPQLLDVWEISIGENCPSEHQPENMKVEGVDWEKKSVDFSIGDLVDGADCEWLNSGNPINRIDRSHFESQNYSSSLVFLCLTHDRNKTNMYYKPNGNGEYKLRLSFFLNGKYFDLPITDSKYFLVTRDFISKELRLVYITVGLGQEHNGAYYKLVVGIITHSQINKQVLI